MARTLPYTPTLLTTAQADAKNGQTHRGGQRFTNRNLSDKTATSKPAYTAQNEDLLFERQFYAMNLHVEWVGGLNVGVSDGVYRKADGTDVTFAGSASFAMTAAMLNQKLWIDTGTNALTKGAAWPADKTTFVPLAEIDTDATAVTEVRPRHGLIRDQVHATATSINSTTDTTFTLDSDNAGAGASQQVRFNRGSTDAEDAAIEWDETNDRYNLRKQHTTNTLAPVNASEVQVGGTAAIESDGDLAAASIATDQLYTFGANGNPANGVKLTPAGSTGAPAAGAHTAGELHVDSAGKVFVCTANGTPGTWQQVGKQDGVLVPSVGDGSASAGNPASCTIQIKDGFGNNVTQATLLIVNLMDDSNGAAFAPNTSGFSVSVGTLVRTITANKTFVCKTDANGTLTFGVTNSIADNVSVLIEPAPGSPALDCQDTGALAWS